MKPSTANFDIDDAKNKLSVWVELLDSGLQREITLTRHGEPAARLVAVNASSQPARRIGVAKGWFQMPTDLDTSAEEAAALVNHGLQAHVGALNIARMFSTRFERPIVVTRHAAQRMAERQIDATLLQRIIDQGELRYSSADRLWAWLDVPDRDDNLICAALVLQDAVVVKTVMHRWELMP